MKYGVAKLSIIPCRSEPADPSEQTSQLLFGEHYKVIEERKKWVRIRSSLDKYEAWIDRKQHAEITEEEYKRLDSDRHATCSLELVGLATNVSTKEITPIPMGSTLPLLKNGSFELGSDHYQFDGQFIHQLSKDKNKIVENAYMYLNAPYLWGGRSPFGIDCSGFSQIIYKLNGIKLPRDAYQQAEIGITLSFVEEAEPGDLAFFDNEEGDITHVGILLEDNYIIHSSGKVRVDRIDHQGIFNAKEHDYTHKLRLIKRIF